MILKANEINTELAAKEIKKGNIVAFPTETVYGLGADGLNPIAVAKIFEAKQRPSFNPLILHISSKKQLHVLAETNDVRVDKLIDKFWPGPLTVVLPKKNIVPDIVTAGHSTVAIRMPNHKVALSLIERSGVPVAAPSANLFGLLSPTTAEHVEKQLKGKVEIVLDGGPSMVGVESTIIEFTSNVPEILRPGGLPIDDIEKVIGKTNYKNRVAENPNSPGQLLHHYAPSVPLHFLNNDSYEKYKTKKIGMLFFKEDKYKSESITKRILSNSGNLREAAANLFKYLHELENENVDVMLVEEINEVGLGIAIMDRLNRAVVKSNN